MGSRVTYFKHAVRVRLSPDQPHVVWGDWLAFGLDGRLSIAITGEAARRLRISGGYPRTFSSERWEGLLDEVSSCRHFLSPIPQAKIGPTVLLYNDDSLVAISEELAQLAEFLAPTSPWLAPSTSGLLEVPIRRGREVIVMPVALEGFSRRLAMAIWACARGEVEDV